MIFYCLRTWKKMLCTYFILRITIETVVEDIFAVESRPAKVNIKHFHHYHHLFFADIMFDKHCSSKLRKYCRFFNVSFLRYASSSKRYTTFSSSISSFSFINEENFKQTFHYQKEFLLFCPRFQTGVFSSPTLKLFY